MLLAFRRQNILQTVLILSDGEWLRERGMERIVQGALRLAAHQLLGERPHFGGKYSERVIEQGIDSIERAFKPAAPPKPLKAPREGAKRQKNRSPLANLPWMARANVGDTKNR